MRFMVIMYPGPKAEGGVEADNVEADRKALEEMGAFNESLVKAGILLAGEGLHPTSAGARVRFPGGKAVVSDGPFTETKEIIGGYWMWQCKDLEEAKAWAARCPAGDDQMLELRRVYEAADFGEALTPELAEAEERLRASVAEQQRQG
jgi:hypothetical protein